MNENISFFSSAHFKTWLLSRFFSNFAKQMQSLIVLWQVYELSRDPLYLGYIGLAEALPFFAVALWAGHWADVRERRWLLAMSQWGQFLCTAVLFAMSCVGPGHLGIIYTMIGLSGACVAIEVAAAGAYSQSLVLPELFPRVAAYNLTLFTLAMIFGPIAGGWIISHFDVRAAYGLATLFFIGASLMTWQLPVIHPSLHATEEKSSGLERIKTGLKFIRTRKLILASMSLDLFAVLFGGAVGLFPIFADLLNINATGLGFLKAAPALGSFIIAFSQTRRVFFKPRWRLLQSVVIIFGLTWIGFALSRNFYVSLLLLLIGGAADGISVIIRSSILQAHTPDHLRGRVVAVGSIFIRSSNEIGAFESGLVAKFLGTVPSVVFGGIMTLVSVAALNFIFPKLKNDEAAY